MYANTQIYVENNSYVLLLIDYPVTSILIPCSVHFRLTVPNTNISIFEGSHAITSPEPVNLLVELVHAEFTEKGKKDNLAELEG